MNEEEIEEKVHQLKKARTPKSYEEIEKQSKDIEDVFWELCRRDGEEEEVRAILDE